MDRRQFQHQGVLIVIDQHEQREEEVRPGADEGRQTNNRESSTHLREEDPPETRPFTRTVNQCCVFNFFGNPKESCAHHEDLEGANHGDHPHTGERLVCPDRHHHRVQGQHDRFEGENHCREDNEVHNVAAGPPTPRKHVATQAGQNDV